MAQNEILKRYIEAGIAFTEVTRARAEEFVKDLARTGEVQWDQVQSQVDELVDWSKRNSDQILSLVRTEVATQLAQLGIATKEHLEALEQRLEETFRERVAAMSPRRRGSTPAPAESGGDDDEAVMAIVDITYGIAAGVLPPEDLTPEAVSAEDHVVPAAPAKKTAAKRAPAKRAPAKKAPAQEVAPAAVEAAATGTVPAPAKKAAAKKAPGKRAAAKTAPAAVTAAPEPAPVKRAAPKKAAAKKAPAAEKAPPVRATAKATGRPASRPRKG